MYKMCSLCNCNNSFAKKYVEKGEIFEVNDENAVKTLIGHNQQNYTFAKVYEMLHSNKKKYDICIYASCLYKIGGIERWLINLSEYIGNRKVCLLIANNMSDDLTLLLYKKGYDIITYGSKIIDCNTLIICHINHYEILDSKNVNYKQVYQMIHANYNEITKISVYSGIRYIKDERIDKVIAVSESAKNGMKNVFNEDCVTIYNPLSYKKEHHLFKLITLTRATPEKGINRIIAFAKKLKEYGYEFVWFLCSSVEEQCKEEIINQIKEIKEIAIVSPNLFNGELISSCDYMVHLSDSESMCYSAYESLQEKVPVILTDYEEARNTIEDGENGYIVPLDENLYTKELIDKIMLNIPKNVTFKDKCDYSKVADMLDGKL